MPTTKRKKKKKMLSISPNEKNLTFLQQTLYLKQDNVSNDLHLDLHKILWH